MDRDDGEGAVNLEAEEMTYDQCEVPAGPRLTRVPVQRLPDRTSPEPEGPRRTGGGRTAGRDRLGRAGRALLIAFAVFTLLAVNQLAVLGGHTEAFFAWTIASRPNSTFLGAAYGAGFVLSVLALRQHRWSRVRIAVVTVTAFTVLTLISTLLHLPRLNLLTGGVVARSAAWVWLTVYVVVPVACLAVVVRQQRSRPRPERVLDPMPGWLRAILLAQGAVLAAAGAIMWVEPAGVQGMAEVMRAPWPWPVCALSSQVIGAWLLSFGFAIGLAIKERDLSRMLVPAAAYTAFATFELLVLLAFAAAPGTDRRWLLVDLVVMVTLVPTGAYGWWRAARGAGGSTVATERA
jgi:hypothetical protein